MAMVQPLSNFAIGNKWWRRHLTDQRLFDGHLNTILRDAARHAGKLVDEGVGDPGIGALVRRAQYNESRSALLRLQEDLWGGINKETSKGIRLSAQRGQEMWREINARLGRSINSTAVRGQFERAAQRAVENIRSRYVNDISLSPSVYRNRQLSMGFVDRTVNRGILLNRSAAEIAKDVRDLIRPDVQGGVSYAAKRLGRTELNNAFHETSRRSAAAQPWVEGMKWHLSGSHPRPDECNDFAEQDNYNMGDGVYPPAAVPGKPHPQCLCYITPETPSDKEFTTKLFNGEYDFMLFDE